MAFLRNLALATVATVAFGNVANAATKPVGTITIDEKQIGFLVGGSLGGGTLSYGGKTYPFKIGGLSVGNIGVSKLKATGEVYNMTSVSQFAGTYAKAEASATLLKGAGALRLENENGVVLELKTTSGGLQLSAGGGGVKITLPKKKK